MSASSHLQQVVLGSFRLLRVLGQGSFATAYLAEQLGTDRKAVVKLAHAHLIHSPHGKMVRERFASEVRASTRVSHPNLVTIYTAGETEDGLPALAMEYLEGETLGQRLRGSTPLTFEELFASFSHLASALERAHASRVIHRDVSPENVFLTNGPHGFALKLLDFGIARLQDQPSLANYAVGTPFYMALEQMKGLPTTASDAYSVGALLWWSLTGSELFDHLTEMGQLLCALETQVESPDPRRIRSSIPDPIAELVRALLAREPEARPTMTQFLERWRSLEPTLRAWWETPKRCTVGLLLPPGPTFEMVTAALERDHAVVRLEPRVSTLLSHPGLGALVIDAECRDLDPIALSRHVAKLIPELRMIAVSTRPFAAAWTTAPVAQCVILPEQLPLLTEILDGCDTGPARARVSSEVARRAMGEIPELLAALDEAVATHQVDGAVQSCERIERIAHLVALTEIESLARTLRVLMVGGAVEDPGAFVAQLHSAYLESFPNLLAAQKA